jgi:predicted dehydrogenase
LLNGHRRCDIITSATLHVENTAVVLFYEPAAVDGGEWSPAREAIRKAPEVAEVEPGVQKVKIGVLGTGYMGRNHARILSDLPEVELVGISDHDNTTLAEVAREFDIEAFDDPSAMMREVSAVVVAVPTDEHYPYALEALSAGLDVLVEKPIADDLAQASELCDLAREKELILQVGHIERFNPVSLELPRLVTEPLYISCERLSHVMPDWQGKTGVVLDLMIHDLDIVLSLVDSPVSVVNSVGANRSSLAGDIAIAQIKFESGTVANFVASRLSQAKVRKISVTQPEEVINIDLLRQTIAVHHLISNDYFFDQRTGYKQETVTEIPYLSRHGEPLRFELESFVKSVAMRTTPVVTGEDGTRALALAMDIIAACD